MNKNTDEKQKLIYNYRGFEIRLFQNSDKWDFNIPEITTKGYKGKLDLYETKEKALNVAKNQIDETK